MALRQCLVGFSCAQNARSCRVADVAGRQLQENLALQKCGEIYFRFRGKDFNKTMSDGGITVDYQSPYFQLIIE